MSESPSEAPRTKKRTILSSRGYAVVKKYTSFQDLTRIKKELTVAPYVNENFAAKPSPFPIYLESHKKLYLPKHYGIEYFGNPDHIKATARGTRINIKFNGQMREKQMPAVNAFLSSCEDGPLTERSKGGIVSLPCGYGKTIIALYLISQLQRKALIIVHKEFLINQWKERISQFVPDARVGIIQGSKVEIDNKDIVLGMLQSISMKEYEDDVFSSFGFTVIDECHHIAAEVFSRALPKINSYFSLGLSATPKRKDGLSKVFHWYLGPMVHQVKKRDGMKVDVKVLMYNCKDPQYCRQEMTAYGKICMPRMINNITNYKRRTFIIIELVRQLRQQNKKILILSDRRQHLTDIYTLIEQDKLCTVGYYVGGMKQAQLKKSESQEVILGTYNMSSEGMDIPDLDSIIFASPKSDIVQSIGRVLRKQHASNPICWDIVDNIPPFSRQYTKRRTYYRKLKYPIHIYTVQDDHRTPIDATFRQLDQTPDVDVSGKRRKKRGSTSHEENTSCLQTDIDFLPFD